MHDFEILPAIDGLNATNYAIASFLTRYRGLLQVQRPHLEFVDLWPELVLPRSIRAAWDPVITGRR